MHNFVAQLSKLAKFQAGSLGYNASLINRNRKTGRTNLNKHTEEWIKQADYDMGVAEFLFKGAKYSYTVFMCHLSMEKSLKRPYNFNIKPFKYTNFCVIIYMLCYNLTFVIVLQ